MPYEIIPIGIIVKPVGRSGVLKVKIYSEGSKSLLNAKEVNLKSKSSEGKNFTVKKVSITPKSANISLLGVDTFEDAERLRGFEVGINAADFPKIVDGGIYNHQILGCEVYSTLGDYVGKLKDIISTKANDVYCVVNDNKEYLIPATDEILVSFDLENKKIIIKIIEGLLGD